MHGTVEASNDGRLRVRIIHGLNISHKELTYLLQKSTSHHKPSTTRMLLGGQIGRKRPTLVPGRHPYGGQSEKHLMLQICYTMVTIRPCYETCKLQHKYYSNSKLLNQHNFNITISISQNNYQVSNFSQYSMHLYGSFYLGCLSYQD